jgi:esterase/lipase
MRAVVPVLAVLLLVSGLLAAGGWLTRPPSLLPEVDASVPSRDLDAWLEASEANTASRYGIVRGAEKRIVWRGEPDAKSELAVVYLHGFSATRREIHPVPQRVAAALGANLFETRLRGHGRHRERLSDVSAEDWLHDGAEALAIGAAIGERLVVMGTSTGATLALALAENPLFERVESLVLLSPNWGPAAAGSDLATGPYGPQLVRLLAGEEHSWQPANEDQKRYWTTRYPTTAIVEMLRLVDLAREMTPRAQVASALMIYSPRDDVVSIPRLLEGFRQLPAKRKETVVIERPRGLSNHVLTGTILATQETPVTVKQIVDFLGGATAEEDAGP